MVLRSSSSDGRSVSVTRDAPSFAATTPGNPGPAPSSTTSLPVTSVGFSQRNCAIGNAASQHSRAVASLSSPASPRSCRTVTSPMEG